MIRPIMSSNDILQQGEYSSGKPTEEIEKMFSQISPIANNRNSIFNCNDDIKENKSFFEESAQICNHQFSDFKLELISEDTRVLANNDNNSLNTKEQLAIDQDQIFTYHRIIIDTDKYVILNQTQKEELGENIVKEPFNIKQTIQDEGKNNLSALAEFNRMPRRSARITNLNEQKALRNYIAPQLTKQNPQKKTLKEMNKNQKKETRKTTASKIKTIRSTRSGSKRNLKRTKPVNNSKKKAENRKSLSDGVSDESSIEVISTNLDLNESLLDEKENARGKKSQNKNKNQTQAPKSSIASNTDLASLTKTFDNFIKFCQTRFDLLEDKITNNKKATNPNGKTANRKAKKMTLNEKMELKNRILNLNREQIMGLYNKIKKHSKMSNQSELEIDLMKIPDKVLKEINVYVDDCLIKEKENFIKDFNTLAKDTENKINEIKANNPNKDFTAENEIIKNPLLGRKRKNCILEDSKDLSESLSSSSSNSFSL